MMTENEVVKILLPTLLILLCATSDDKGLIKTARGKPTDISNLSRHTVTDRFMLH
jgi:hypothetical protein